MRLYHQKAGKKLHKKNPRYRFSAQDFECTEGTKWPTSKKVLKNEAF